MASGRRREWAGASQLPLLLLLLLEVPKPATGVLAHGEAPRLRGVDHATEAHINTA